MSKKYESLWDGPKTVGDFIELLSEFPSDWEVKVKTPAGGGIGVEHREIDGTPVIAIFGKNGGRFGENPLTEEEYQKQSRQFLEDFKCGRVYTTIYGDDRTYDPSLGPQATCYGRHYDSRIIKRMADENLIDMEHLRRFGCVFA